jgi:competence protein ComEA
VPDPNDPQARLAATRPQERGTPQDQAFWGDARAGRVGMPPRPRSESMFEALRERFGDWRSDARFGVAILVVVAVVAGILWYRIGVSSGDDDPAPAKRTTTSTKPLTPTSGASAATTADGGVVVHVAGAVARPGVVELARGSRVIDAIEAAGGGTPEADLDRLNLAAKLADGERVLVQRVGEPAVANGTDGGAGDETTATGGLVNLNTATQVQLEELPGIGPTLAAAIVDERERRGGFRSVNELRDVRGIGEKRFADLRERVTV